MNRAIELILSPVIGAGHSFAEAKEANWHFEGRGHFGKVVNHGRSTASRQRHSRGLAQLISWSGSGGERWSSAGLSKEILVKFQQTRMIPRLPTARVAQGTECA